MSDVILSIDSLIGKTGLAFSSTIYYGSSDFDSGFETNFYAIDII